MFLGLAVFIWPPQTLERFTGVHIGVVDQFNAPSKTPGYSHWSHQLHLSGTFLSFKKTEWHRKPCPIQAKYRIKRLLQHPACLLLNLHWFSICGVDFPQCNICKGSAQCQAFCPFFICQNCWYKGSQPQLLKWCWVKRVKMGVPIYPSPSPFSKKMRGSHSQNKKLSKKIIKQNLLCDLK